MQKKILFLCPYPINKAPSQRLKFEQYYSIFQTEFQIEHSSFISNQFWKIIYKKGNIFKKIYFSFAGYITRVNDLIRIRNFDIVYVHLWVTPFGPPLFEWLVRKLAKKVVYDIDDLVYLKSTKSKAHSIVNYIKGYKKPIYLMKVSDHVITCTPYLDEYVRKHNSRTTDISSTVDTNLYQPINRYQNDKKLTIGWSGSLTTSRFFMLLKVVLQKIALKYDVEVIVMGDPDVKIEGVSLKAVPWTTDNELSTLQKFDIGVYPLPDEEWVYGKSGLKAIQYMAMGIPTIATAIGANYRVIEHGVSGYLVKQDDEWIHALSLLIENADLRKQIGIAGRRRIENLYSIKANQNKYLEILKNL